MGFTFMTVKETAEYLKILPTDASLLVLAGAIPAAKIGGQWRIPKEELDKCELITERQLDKLIECRAKGLKFKG